MSTSLFIAFTHYQYAERRNFWFTWSFRIISLSDWNNI